MLVACLRRFIVCVCGVRNVKRIEGAVDYCCWKPNPFMQVSCLIRNVGELRLKWVN